jgi:hypothetical protein
MIWTVWSVSNHGKQVSSNWLLENVPILSCALPHKYFFLFSFITWGELIFWFSSETEKSGTLLQTDGNEAELLTVNLVIGLVLRVLKKS